MIERLDYRDDLTDASKLAQRLSQTGLSDAASRAKADRFARAAAALARPHEPAAAQHIEPPENQ